MQEGKRRQPVYAVIVAVFAAMAIAGPVKMITHDGGGSGVGDRVGMAGLTFRPGTLQVARGTVVTWTNDDVVPHTVTSNEASIGIDSGVLRPGQTFTATVEKAFSYRCDIHPSMQATVEVSG